MLPDPTPKIRKRSFTNYQNSLQFDQELLNQVLQQKDNSLHQIRNPETQNNSKQVPYQFTKSSKAKVLHKFQKFHVKTARTLTENCHISTFQSLKKQIMALECDQVMSYRPKTMKQEFKRSEQHDQGQYKNQSEIQAMITKFRNLKKQAMADKCRRKFLQFKGGKIQMQMKTNGTLARNTLSLTKSDKMFIIKDQSKPKNMQGEKIIERRQQYLNQKIKNGMSLTARRFYENKSSHTRAKTESSLNIYDRQRSIKKLPIQERVFGKSIISQ